MAASRPGHGPGEPLSGKREKDPMTRRFASILVLMLGLAACSAPSGGGGGASYAPSGPGRDLLSWQGQPASVLEQHLGPPDSVEKLDRSEEHTSELQSRR